MFLVASLLVLFIADSVFAVASNGNEGPPNFSDFNDACNNFTNGLCQFGYETTTIDRASSRQEPVTNAATQDSTTNNGNMGGGGNDGTSATSNNRNDGTSTASSNGNSDTTGNGVVTKNVQQSSSAEETTMKITTPSKPLADGTVSK